MAGAAAVTVAAPRIWSSESSPDDVAEPGGNVKLSLNTSTVRGHRLSVPEQIRVTADAGYDAIEPWIRDLRECVEGGTDAAAIGRMIGDAGLSVAGAIGFARWISDDPKTRRQGLEEARRDMDLIRAVGGDSIAAPPIGAHTPESVSPPLDVIADRFAALCDVGADAGVMPLLEVWGFSPTLSKLADVAYVLAAAGHPNAGVLPDFYHLHRGGNDFESLRFIEASRMPNFHINDYPTDKPASDLVDADRVFPGDGGCPLVEVIRGLLEDGFTGTFSLELFNPDYWSRPAAEVAIEGRRKCRQIIAAAQRSRVGGSKS